VFAGYGDADLWFANFTKHPAYYGVVEALTNNTKCKTGKNKMLKRSKPLIA
jgi:endo-1,4-beta-xylanase